MTRIGLTKTWDLCVCSTDATGPVGPFSPDHFWLCPIPFVLEYPNQPDNFPCMLGSTEPLQIWWRRPYYGTS